MDTNQQPTSSIPDIPAPPPGLFGTRIPSLVSFSIGILLFLLPFFEINLGNIFVVQKSGLGVATGNEWKLAEKGFMGNIIESGGSISTVNKKNDPNIYALTALAVGLTGLVLSIPAARSASGIAMFSGVLSAGTLIGLWFDLKKTMDIPFIGSGDIVNLSFQPTPWFYIAIVAFLAAAFFCYRRMQLTKH